MKSLPVSSGRLCWLLTVTTLASITVLCSFGPWSDSMRENPELLFTMVTVSAALCVIAATVVIALADRRDMAEIGLLGAALMVTSVMPLVHGLVTPGVLYDDNEAFRTSSYLAFPVAMAVASPLLLSNTTFGRWAARRWRDWTLLSLLGIFVLGSVVVFFPDWISPPAPHSPVTIALSVVMLVAVGSLSVRQLRLHELGGHPSHLVASLSLASLSVAALLPAVDTPYSATFWWCHIAGVLGVLGVCVGLAVSKQMTRSVHDVLAPVLARDPLAAFELGLSPAVHQFVADLDRKDQATRDHVIRTGELALRVGERMGLSARDLRDLGLAAMLHDIGKINTPDAILRKPARLTDAEYDVIKRHTVDGEAMLAAEPTLAGCARIVRSHHERMDGRGYPDGLVGGSIPVAARIIAVCDALDAMTHDRQYRAALSVPMAFAILREHAGSQWDHDVVRHVMATFSTMSDPSVFDAVGRSGERVDELVVPDDVGAILEAVDVEI